MPRIDGAKALRGSGAAPGRERKIEMIRDRELVTESCKTCKKPVYADEGYYSVTGEHYDCHQRGQKEFKRAADRLDQLLDRKLQTARKPQTVRRERGEGESVAKLKVMIVEALRKKFET